MKKKYSDAELTLLLADVSSTDFFRKNGALEKLRDAEANSARRAEVARLLEPILDPPEKNPFLRRNACQALGVWGDVQSVPVLIERFSQKENDIFLRQIALEAVGLLKDERAAEPVASYLGDFFLRGHAAKSLKSMGAVAEKAVVKLLEHNDAGMRVEACKILRESGSKASVPALQAAAMSRNPDVAGAAGEALKVVSGQKEERVRR